MKLTAVLIESEHGQDLIEYALLCGFVVLAAASVMPGAAAAVARIYARVLFWLTVVEPS
jgi:hypothetical protein